MRRPAAMVEAGIRDHHRATDKERAELDSLLVRERRWYGETTRYQTVSEVEADQASGRLLPIPPDHPHMRPIYRFRENIQPKGTYPLLTTTALAMTYTFGEVWRHCLDEMGLNNPHLRLGLTSMTRIMDYQDEIIADGALGANDTTHGTGNTFDTDASGYIVIHGKHLAPIIDPEREVPDYDFYADQRRIHGDYDPRITQAAIKAAQSLHLRNLVNLIPELMGTARACLHMAVNPDFQRPSLG